MNSSSELILEAKSLAKYIRVQSLLMVSRAGTSHVGSCLSVAEIIATVQIKTRLTEDVIIFSKGHAAAAMYASLAGIGVISQDRLVEFGKDGSELIGHINHKIDGVFFSTGSLGHGLPIGIGVSIASKLKHVFIIMSDGELNEGTTWESLAIAKQLNLGNLTVIIDTNGIQSFGHTNKVLNLEPLVNKFKNFGWNTLEVDGHSIPQLLKSLNVNLADTPKIIIARTTKGKGVKTMEDKLEWHYKSPDKIDLDKYIDEIEKNA